MSITIQPSHSITNSPAVYATSSWTYKSTYTLSHSSTWSAHNSSLQLLRSFLRQKLERPSMGLVAWYDILGRGRFMASIGPSCPFSPLTTFSSCPFIDLIGGWAPSYHMRLLRFAPWSRGSWSWNPCARWFWRTYGWLVCSLTLIWRLWWPFCRYWKWDLWFWDCEAAW